MNRILLGVFAVALCFAVGHTLQCYKCDIGFFGACITTTTQCTGTDQCFSGEGKAASLVKVTMKGCLNVGQCNQTTSVNFPSNSNTSVYQMTKTCCNTDLCNTAPGLPKLSTLTLGLLSLIPVFFAKFLL